MADWAKAHLKANQAFSKSDVVPWFAQHYPKTKRNTVGMHVEGMSINNPVRKHHPSIKPGSGYDLFFKLGRIDTVCGTRRVTANRSTRPTWKRRA
jgi:hypothetical protein